MAAKLQYILHKSKNMVPVGTIACTAALHTVNSRPLRARVSIKIDSAARIAKQKAGNSSSQQANTKHSKSYSVLHMCLLAQSLIEAKDTNTHTKGHAGWPMPVRLKAHGEVGFLYRQSAAAHLHNT